MITKFKYILEKMKTMHALIWTRYKPCINDIQRALKKSWVLSSYSAWSIYFTLLSLFSLLTNNIHSKTYILYISSLTNFTTKNEALIGVLFGLESAEFSGGMTLRRFGKTPINMPWERGTSAFWKTPIRG